MTRLVAYLLDRFGDRRRLFLAAALGVLVWVAFFDSHSLVRRLHWQHQVNELREENRQLSNEIVSLQETLAAGLSRADIERIARTQYGMSREGETVHPVLSADSK